MEYFRFGINPTPAGDFYFEDEYDARIRRVKKLLAPAGTDKTPIGIYHFIYDLNIQPHKKKSKQRIVQNGGCDVIDALGNHTVYSFNSDHRLDYVHKYDQNRQHYTTEFMFWGPTKTGTQAQLISHALEHKGYGLLFNRTYRYDSFGNVLVDFLYGNLSGDAKVLPAIGTDGKTLENGCECYKKTYTYSSDGLNLVLKETDGIRTTFFKYYPGTNRLQAKFEGTEQTCMRRSFYEYNADAALTKEIADDGSSTDISDFSGITERHITYYAQSTAYPVAYPLVIEEKCTDFTSGQELLIQKVVNIYNNQAKITRQEHYDSQNNLAYVLTWEYNLQGLPFKETNALGQLTERNYDDNGNCIQELCLETNVEKNYTYDLWTASSAKRRNT